MREIFSAEGGGRATWDGDVFEMGAAELPSTKGPFPQTTAILANFVAYEIYLTTGVSTDSTYVHTYMSIDLKLSLPPWT